MISAFALCLLLVLQMDQATLPLETAGEAAVAYSEALRRDVYLLGPGDLLTAVVEGGCSDVMILSGLLPSALCPVSGDGSLQMPGVGQIQADGLTLDDAQQQLQALARRYYPGIRIGLSLYEPRIITMWVSGMVDKPGRYSLLSVQKVSDLVHTAGGFTPYGSRRGFMYLAEGDSVAVDLSFGGDGRPVSDPYLRNGASVVIPPVRRPVFLARPGLTIYATDGTLLPNARHQVEAWDFQAEETVAEFLRRTGGPEGRLDPAGSVLVSGSAEYPVWSPDDGFSPRVLMPGDTLRMAYLANQVFVSGAVNRPGTILYHSGMTVRDCVDMAGGANASGRTGGTVLSRMGSVIARGSDAMAMEARPGDVIEVPYSIESRYQTTIVILASIVTMTATIINLTRD